VSWPFLDKKYYTRVESDQHSSLFPKKCLACKCSSRMEKGMLTTNALDTTQICYSSKRSFITFLALAKIIKRKKKQYTASACGHSL
jgi:hypothetical protein